VECTFAIGNWKHHVLHGAVNQREICPRYIEIQGMRIETLPRNCKVIVLQPSKLFLYPYIAGWLVRSEGIEKHDFGFVKNLSLGGAVLDPATAELLEKVFSSALLNQVSSSNYCPLAFSQNRYLGKYRSMRQRKP
jgi:hypothetical protein